MKRIISLVIAMMIVMTAFGSVTFASSPVWDGTYDVSWYNESDTVFHISTAEEFAGIAAIQNGTEQEKGGIVSSALAGKTVILDNDIYLNDTLSWADGALTNEDALPFTTIANWAGTLDGNGKTIYGLYVDDTLSSGTEQYVGMFSHIWDGTVKNLKVSNAFVIANNGWKSIGILVGRNQSGLIKDVHITNAYVAGLYANIGGVLGNNDTKHEGDPYPGIVDGCSTDSTVTVAAITGGSCGGIAGANKNENGVSFGISTVKNCTSSAVIRGFSYMGGIVAENIAAVDNCVYSNGTIEPGAADTWCSGTGGITGVNKVNGNQVGIVKNCAVIDATVSTMSWEAAGGITGFNNGGSITNCYCVNSTVTNAYPSAGGITGNNGDALGTVTNCYSNSTIVSGWNNNAGIVWINGSATNCYYLKTDSVNSTTVVCGSGVTSTNCDTFDTDYVLAGSGKSVADALNEWVSSNDGYNTWVMDNVSGYVVFGEAEVVEEIPEFIADSTTLGGCDFANEVIAEKYITAFSKVYIPASYTGDVEFGIIFASSDNALDADTVKANGKEYKASGSLADGSFAVKLINGEGETDFFSGAFNGFIPYIKYGTEVVYDNLVTIIE